MSLIQHRINKCLKTGNSTLDLSNTDLTNNIVILNSYIFALQHVNYIKLTHNNLSGIPIILRSLRALKKVDLSNNNITNICNPFIDENITALNLSNNPLSVLPNSIISLVNLEMLLISGCNITIVPPYISKLVNLKVLNLSNNNIKFICYNIFEFNKKLISLSISNNCMNSLTFICNNEHLKVLIASKNNIASLNGITKCKNLKVLDLSYNNISIITNSIKELTTLTALNLRGNNILHINIDTILFLENIKTLRMSGDFSSCMTDEQLINDLSLSTDQILFPDYYLMNNYINLTACNEVISD